MTLKENEYILQIDVHSGSWLDIYAFDALDHDEAAKTASEWIDSERPSEGTTYRLLQDLGSLEVAYVAPPPPPEPELEQLSFG